MAKNKTPKQQKSSAINWLWLAVGAVMVPFIPAQTPIALAAWLAPVFLLRFSRTTRPLIALPVLGVVFFVGMWIALRDGFVPGEPADLYITVIGATLAYVVLFALDKVLSRRFSGIAGTLVFPVASTAIGFAATFGNPLGTAGSEAYSQTLPMLLQTVSLTGIWGLVFLMYWFAAVVNYWWEQGFSFSRVKVAIGAFVLVCGALLGFGGIRLAMSSAQPADSTVKMAGIAPSKMLNEQTMVTNISTPEARQATRDALRPLLDDFFARTKQEAREGAKIIVWSEASAKILKEDEGEFTGRAKQLAKEAGIYLQAGVSTYAPNESGYSTENRAILFTPQGDTAWDYHKAKITPGDLEKPGSAQMPTIDTPYGTLGTIICQDDLFPEYVAQAGQKGVDILLVPSSDWKAIAGWHSHVSTFRAIENGTAIFRPTRSGHSVAVDASGRQLTVVGGYDANHEQTLRADVPTSGSPTLYSRLPDALAYGSGLGLIVFVGAAIVRRTK